MTKKKLTIEEIEQLMYPNSGNLVVDEEGGGTAIILDAWIYPLQCAFNYSDSVVINTEGLQDIELSLENLYRLIELIEEQSEISEKLDKET